MVGFIIILSVFLCLNITNVNCDVIIRESNSKEGSVCILNDGFRGICRSECAGQAKTEYVSEVCHANGDRTLYCCVNKERRTRYPTLDKVCMDQYLLEDCNQQSLEHPEGERSDFVKSCIDVTTEQKPSYGIQSGRKLTDFPYLLGIGWQTTLLEWGGYRIFWNCTGVQIHDNYVLVQAFCVNGLRNYYFQFKNFGVLRLGYPDLSFTEADYNIDEIFVFPNYTLDTYYNDLAILKVTPAGSYSNKKIENKLRPRPICLWTERSFPTDELSSLGFIIPDPRELDQAKFFKLKPMVQNKDVCKFSEKDLAYGITDNMLCTKADHLEARYETYISGATTSTETGWLKMPQLVGIQSWPITNRNVSVDTLLYGYLDWIEEVISQSP